MLQQEYENTDGPAERKVAGAESGGKSGTATLRKGRIGEIPGNSRKGWEKEAGKGGSRMKHAKMVRNSLQAHGGGSQVERLWLRSKRARENDKMKLHSPASSKGQTALVLNGD